MPVTCRVLLPTCPTQGLPLGDAALYSVHQINIICMKMALIPYARLFHHTILHCFLFLCPDNYQLSYSAYMCVRAFSNLHA